MKKKLIREKNPKYIETIMYLIEWNRLSQDCMNERKQKILVNKIKNCIENFTKEEEKDMVYLQEALKISYNKLQSDEVKELINNL